MKRGLRNDPCSQKSQTMGENPIRWFTMQETMLCPMLKVLEESNYDRENHTLVEGNKVSQRRKESEMQYLSKRGNKRTRCQEGKKLERGKCGMCLLFVDPSSNVDEVICAKLQH